MSLATSLIHLAAEEGKATAICECEKIMSVLETICECGSTHEMYMAGDLLANVREASKQIRETNAVQIARDNLDS